MSPVLDFSPLVPARSSHSVADKHGESQGAEGNRERLTRIQENNRLLNADLNALLNTTQHQNSSAALAHNAFQVQSNVYTDFIHDDTDFLDDDAFANAFSVLDATQANADNVPVDNVNINTLNTVFSCLNEVFKTDPNDPTTSEVANASFAASASGALGLHGPRDLASRALAPLSTLRAEAASAAPSTPSKSFARYSAFSTSESVLSYEKGFLPAEGERALFSFNDASDYAFGACQYLCQRINGEVKIALCFAKSKVTPSAFYNNKNEAKRPTTPRVELLSLQLAARMTNYAAKVFDVDLKNCYLWTDSSICLARLQTDHHRFSVWVSNRCADIIKHTNVANWRWVPTDQNPADFLSRGMHLPELLTSELWANGPDFLYTQKWPLSPVPLRHALAADVEMLPPPSLAAAASVLPTVQDVAADNQTLQHLEKLSSFSRVVRIIGYIFRWKSISAAKSHSASGQKPTALTGIPDKDIFKILKLETTLQPEEFANARSRLLGLAQKQDKAFTKAMNQLFSQNFVDPTLHLAKYDCFVDEAGLLRSRTRLQAAQLPYEARNPLLLPRGSHIVRLLVRELHQKNYCLATNMLMHLLHTKYRIIGGRGEIRRHAKTCQKCQNELAKKHNFYAPEISAVKDFRLAQQVMEHLQVDMFGHLNIRHNCKNKKCPHKVTNKAYVCMFSDLVTRYCTMYVVEDLKTSSFLEVLSRHCAMFGTPTHIYSDGAKYFTAADKALASMYKNINWQEVQSKFQQIKWSFGTPTMSWSQACVEKHIHLAKNSLKRSLGRSLLSKEQLQDLLTETASLLNGRPLIGQLSNETHTLDYTTPNELVMMKKSVQLSPDARSYKSNVMDIKSDFFRLLRHRRLILNHAFRAWQRSYLESLATSPYWRKDGKNRAPQVGDVVLVISDKKRLPAKLGELKPPSRGAWLLAIVEQIHPSPDGVVRSATIRIASDGRIFTRPARKLCLLEASQ